MQTYKITELARKFGLSRSTLLYYDRIGLLQPLSRNKAGYRLYSAREHDRLAVICNLRRAGLGMDDIGRILSTGEDANQALLQRRLRELGVEILALQAQQHLLAKMLQIQIQMTQSYRQVFEYYA